MKAHPLQQYGWKWKSVIFSIINHNKINSIGSQTHLWKLQSLSCRTDGIVVIRSWWRLVGQEGLSKGHQNTEVENLLLAL